MRFSLGLRAGAPSTPAEDRGLVPASGSGGCFRAVAERPGRAALDGTAEADQCLPEGETYRKPDWRLVSLKRQLALGSLVDGAFPQRRFDLEYVIVK